MPWLLKQIIYLSVILLAPVTGFIKWRSLSKAFKTLSVLLLTTFLFETTAVFSAYVFKNNALVYDIFDPAEVLLFTYVFANLFKRNPAKKIITAIGISIVLIIIFSSVFFVPGILINTLSVVIKSIFFIILSLLKFRNMLAEPNYESVVKEPVFWLCTAVLLFFTINILFWSAYNYLSHTHTKIGGSFIDILYYSNIVFYLMLWYCFVVIKKNRRYYNNTNG